MKEENKLKTVVESGRIVVAPGAFDCLSAKIIQEAGFPVVYATAGGIARTLGYNKQLITMTELVQHVKYIVDCVDVPVFANADTGFGNAVSAMRSVREFEKIGVAGIHMDDRISPQRFGEYGQRLLISGDEMVKKIEAAKKARGNPDFLLIACTDARSGGDIRNAIVRGRRYAEAGADMIFIESLESRKEIQEVSEGIQLPLVINIFRGGRSPNVTLVDLEKMGYRLAIVPSLIQLGAIKGMIDFLETFKNEKRLDFFDGIKSFAERDRLAQYGELEQEAKEFLSL